MRNPETSLFVFLFVFFPNALTISDVSKKYEELFVLSEVFTTGSIGRLFNSGSLDLTPKCDQVLKAAKADKGAFLMMIDAWGKPGTAILQDNINWIGRSSECRDVRISAPNLSEPEKTEHSLVVLNVGTNGSIPLKSIYGVCLPEVCNTDDVFEIMDALLMKADKVKAEVVQVIPPGDGKYDWRFYFAVVIYALLILCVGIGTLLDVYNNREPKYEKLENSEINGAINQNSVEQSNGEVEIGKSKVKPPRKSGIGEKMLLAFSLTRNIPKLMSTKSAEGSIGCLNGIRVLSLGWVILGHTGFYLFKMYPLPTNMNNYKYMSDNYISQFTFQMVDNATFSVDSFFVLSGFLLTYLTLKKLQSVDGKIKLKFWILFYVRRYIRLTPAMMFVILATVGFWKVFGNNSSPLWQPYEEEVDSCKTNWWTNMFYINNLFSSNYCIGWTWYLANDFQFYAISPPIIILMYKYPLVGGTLTALMTAVSCGASAIVSHDKNLPPGSTSYLMNPIVATEFDIRSFNTIYIKPWTRFNSYGIGMFLGWFVFKKPPKSFRVPFYVPIIGWVVGIMAMFWPLFGLWKIPGGDLPSRGATAVYNSLARVSFSMGVGWVIWACMFGYGFFVNTLLSLGIWLPVTRLTYMTYLVHCLVIRFLYGTADDLFNFTLITFSSAFIVNIIFAYCTAFILVLLMESPIMGIEKIFIR